MRFVAAGAENRAADCENAGKSGAIQIDSPVLDQTTKAVAKTDDLPPIVAKRGFAGRLGWLRSGPGYRRRP